MPMVRLSEESKKLVEKIKTRLGFRSIDDVILELVGFNGSTELGMGMVFKRTWRPNIKYLRPEDFPIREPLKLSSEVEAVYVAFDMKGLDLLEGSEGSDWFNVMIEKGFEAIAKEHIKYGNQPLLITGIREKGNPTKIILYAVYLKTKQK